jgi:hypothetical protein
MTVVLTPPNEQLVTKAQIEAAIESRLHEIGREIADEAGFK